MRVLMGGLVAAVCAHAVEVGVRPYELDWANRHEDDHPALVDFEDEAGWRVETEQAEARFERSRQEQIWGRYVGKLTYRGTGRNPSVRVLAPEPLPIEAGFDTVSCWIYGNTWSYSRDATTPQVQVAAVFADSGGGEVSVPLGSVGWKEWFLCRRRLTQDQAVRMASGGTFLGFTVTRGRNEDDRVIYLDNLAVFTETFPPLDFRPRPERGITMFPGQGAGTNTGPGRLPFPTRPETILPDNLCAGSTSVVRREGDSFLFQYQGRDGRLTYCVRPEARAFDGISARWEGRGDWFRPCSGGGVRLADADGKAVEPQASRCLDLRADGQAVVGRWSLTLSGQEATVVHTFRIWGKSLVVDTVSSGGGVVELRFGRVQGLERPRLVTLPFYHYGATTRPAVVVAGAPARPLFFTGHIDWCLSNASEPWAENAVRDEGVAYNGGVRYRGKTDGTRNDCFERFFLTVSPRFEELLPNIPNPESPWKQVTGTRLWRAHGAGNRENDAAFWRKVHRYGMTEVVVTDHETGWRDGGESFTFRTRTAPGKGGDEGQVRYARLMQDELGFVYGPYNNYTDFAPVNEFWHADLINRRPDKQLQGAWARCYAPKPARAVEYCETLAPAIEEKFGFSTAYCDVHTCVTPWSRVDYDTRVPGAGTFGAVFYAYGEIMLLQKQAWDGPVYSEGNNHCFYCGLTDGNYAQDQAYRIPVNPWLVDFDLRKMHPLCCNFGMGNLGMFYGRNTSLGRNRKEIDASIDRFLAATVAFGHTGFLAFEGGYHNALRSYYMLQQLHRRYALARAEDIRYVAADGRLLDSTAAVATGAFTRSQVVVRYSDGTTTAANGSPQERMKVDVAGRRLDLAPNGYVGWTEDGAVHVLSTDVDGNRFDYAVTPAHLYIDGRGRFVRQPQAAGNGVGICRILNEDRFEVILHDGSECGFALDTVSAQALDEQRKVMGSAELRRARGLTYVRPVAGAFSYMLKGKLGASPGRLACSRDTVVPGETVVVRGQTEHRVTVPADAKPGERVWRRIEEEWIDFTVTALADVSVSLNGAELRLGLRSHLAEPVAASVSVRGRISQVHLVPLEEAGVSFDLGTPACESTETLMVGVEAGGLRQAEEVALVALEGYAPVVDMPEGWQGGMCVRGGTETTDFGTSGTHVVHGKVSCGGDEREAVRMHPPWKGGVGYAYALFEPVALPAAPAAAFRASVGKGDGSDLGDGILYRVVVVDDGGAQSVVAEQVVARHEWVAIEGDLGPWAGRTVRLKLVSDVGPADDSSGDWACWAGMRLAGRDRAVLWSLGDPPEAYRTEPGPSRCPGLSVAQLRAAVRGWLHYDGMGLSGTGGAYESYAVVNGVKIGPMAPANGSENDGVWTEGASVALTPEAIATLGYRNRFELRNPGRDWFKVRRFWIELELADGRMCSSDVSTAAFTQPPSWPHAEGIGVVHGEPIAVDIWFAR